MNLTCLLPCICTGSSGVFSHTVKEYELWMYMTNIYTLTVTAQHHDSRKCVSISSSFRVFGHQEQYFCSANMINTRTLPQPQQGGHLEFIAVGKGKSFKCRIYEQNNMSTPLYEMFPCKLKYTLVSCCFFL